MTVLRTTDDDVESTGHAAIATVRVPNGADGGLALEVERRLTAVDGVTEVAVDGLRGIEPRLSATVVTATVTVRAEVSVAGEVRDRVSDGPGVENVDFGSA